MIGALQALVGFLGPSPIVAARRAVSPNPYAPRLGSQQAIASTQTVRAGIAGGLAGAPSGSEPDWATTQGYRPSVYQDLTARAIPPSWFSPNEPLAYFHGPLVLEREPWGQSQRAKAPRILPWTLLPPLARTPKPREMAASYLELNAGHTRLADAFAGDY